MKYIKTYEKKSKISLIDAVENSDIEKIEKYIKSGKNVNDERDDICDNTALILATNATVVRLLLKAGADVNIQNCLGNTALMCLTDMIAEGKPEYIIIEIMTELIKAGADWDIKNNDNLDFFEMLNDEWKGYLKKKFSKEYETYLMKKEVEKYNI